MANKKWMSIRRLIGSMVFILFLLGMVLACSLLWSYFHTGARPGDALHISQELRQEHTPSVSWSDRGAEGISGLDVYTRAEVEKRYIQAWELANLYHEGNYNGLEDLFADSIRVQLENSIDHQSEQRIHRIDLRHNLELVHFSIDHQVIAFRDKGVIIKERLFENEDLINEWEIRKDYEVMMTLDDGRWRVRHMRSLDVTEATEESEVPNRKDLVQVEDGAFVHNGNRFPLNGVNYYPSDFPWFDFWEEFRVDTIDADLAIARDIGFNAVRIFIQYETFGRGHVEPIMLDKLEQFLSLAEKHGLYAVVTLFDFPPGFALKKYSETDRHLESILTRFKDHGAILAWDLKNEPDIDFQYHEPDQVKNWLSYMLHQAREYDPNHLITIGWANAEYATLFKEKVDFVSFHYYDDPKNLGQTISKLKRTIDKPLVVEEFGIPSVHPFIPLAPSMREKQQRDIQTMVTTMDDAETGYMLWTLKDFTSVPSEVFGYKPWIRHSQKHYGIVTTSGEFKPAVEVFKANPIAHLDNAPE